MSDVNVRIRKRIDAFVNELTKLVRGAALDAVTNALNQPLKTGSLRRPRRKSAAGTTPARGSGSTSGKRSGAEIEATTRQLLDHIGHKPGQGMEQIAKALGTQSKALTLPVKRLLAAGQLVSRGHKRATKYFATAGEATAASAAPVPKAKRPTRKKSKSRRRKSKARARKKA
jgi:hypothetical protein